jgi:hypothetical protein
VLDRDAALTEKPVVKDVLKKGGAYYLTLKENQSDLLEWSHFISQNMPLDTVIYVEVKCGAVWTHTLEV